MHDFKAGISSRNLSMLKSGFERIVWTDWNSDIGFIPEQSPKRLQYSNRTSISLSLTESSATLIVDVGPKSTVSEGCVSGPSEIAVGKGDIELLRCTTFTIFLNLQRCFDNPKVEVDEKLHPLLGQ